MQIAILTFDGFNELDSFVAATILNRMKAKGWTAHITSPTSEVTSMNGVTDAREAIHYVAPVGEKNAYIDRALAAVTPFL